MGCMQFSSSEITFPSEKNLSLTSISEINRQQIKEKVYLKGQVEATAPLLKRGAYKLEDEKGSIWIVTTQKLPQLGDILLIEGRVEYRDIPLGETNQEERYVQELQIIAQRQDSSQD